ncbi:MAG TPA: 4-(cytidine 5'-diphospho)-2-C-methyl-D-erythritol kinase [Humidesulfovibrio sp.]|uniref:4-(cytidine 5'-diphospho)-2-C-methyl-D-erythritol kinase n=1 Tax=Humidesulfovibrio sp. TaxID=2910988 RepID=UPI002B5BEBD8|nr:4-(cytidine 5'-diphospho)-2-C-methyl-D-erythritol kinase [Humidesulfovibrio sp.]HWR04569.1 4-(cytidine 5'-diphospho)-2-C-methyl-D-erythritol kinase [Humidesulfovibrio sp.]
MPETLQAPAKINLSLFVTGRREDGYHTIESLFVPVPGLADTLEISSGAPGSGCRVSPLLPGCPEEKNLVFRAWWAYAEATDFAPDISVRLIKRIPTGAGLGGGSSDAAAMLRWLEAKAGAKALGPAGLNALAAKLGADVAFFLLSGPAIARSIGEELTPVELDLSPFTLVLALPEVHVSTPWAYQAWDQWETLKNPARSGADCLTSTTTANKRRVSLSPVVARNDFEVVVFPVHAALRAIKEQLLRLGAISAVMSGSGAGIASLFRDSRQARNAAEALRQDGVPVHVETQRHWGVAKR